MAKKAFDDKIAKCFITAEEKIAKSKSIKQSEQNILKNV